MNSNTDSKGVGIQEIVSQLVPTCRTEDSRWPIPMLLRGRNFVSRNTNVENYGIPGHSFFSQSTLDILFSSPDFSFRPCKGKEGFSTPF